MNQGNWKEKHALKPKHIVTETEVANAQLAHIIAEAKTGKASGAIIREIMEENFN